MKTSRTLWVHLREYKRPVGDTACKIADWKGTGSIHLSEDWGCCRLWPGETSHLSEIWGQWGDPQETVSSGQKERWWVLSRVEWQTQGLLWSVDKGCKGAYWGADAPGAVPAVCSRGSGSLDQGEEAWVTQASCATCWWLHDCEKPVGGDTTEWEHPAVCDLFQNPKKTDHNQSWTTKD